MLDLTENWYVGVFKREYYKSVDKISSQYGIYKIADKNYYISSNFVEIYYIGVFRKTYYNYVIKTYIINKAAIMADKNFIFDPVWLKIGIYTGYASFKSKFVILSSENRYVPILRQLR